MSRFLNVSDLSAFAPDIDVAKATQMIQDAEALAVLTAPCLSSLTTAPEDETSAEAVVRLDRVNAVRAILRGAIQRWIEAGSGAVQTQINGPFSQTTQYQGRRAMFWPSELTQLQAVCADATTGKAYGVDTVAIGSGHLPWCDLYFDASACSCGVDIAGYPIFEL